MELERNNSRHRIQFFTGDGRTIWHRLAGNQCSIVISLFQRQKTANETSVIRSTLTWLMARW